MMRTKGISKNIPLVRLALLILLWVLGLSGLALAVNYDLIKDGYIDGKDLGAFVEKWLFDCSLDDCGGANLNNDNNNVDFADFALLAQRRLKAADPNLVGWWKFDEGSGTTAYDSAGSNDGTINGAVWTTGQIGGALSFDGTDDYVSCPNNVSLNVPAGLTIGTWVYMNASGNYPAVVTKGVGAFDWGYCLRFNAATRKINLYLENANESWTKNANTAVPLNQWTHIAAVYDGVNTVRYYFNGTPDGSYLVTGGSILSNSANLLIGKRIDGFVFNGRIDDVRIYNRALSAVEIRSLVGIEGYAWNPRPANGATNVETNVVLDWSPGAYADSHDVYFGPDFNDVNDANVTYTYRFNVIPADDSNPHDAAIVESQVFVDVEPFLSNQVLFRFRNTGPEASSIARVYFDNGSLFGIASLIDADDVYGGVEGHPGVDFSLGANPGNLPRWRELDLPFKVIDGFLAGADPPLAHNGVGPGEWLGIVFNLQEGRSFSNVISELASGEVRIGIHVVSFSPGSESATNNSNPILAPNVYKGRQEPNSYDPCGLELDTTYYWRIDEVNGTDIWKGQVWSFTTPKGVVADFFAVPTTGWDIYYTAEFVSISTGNITGYLWEFGDGQTSTELTASHKYASPGTYTVSLTVSRPGDSDTITKTNYITVRDFNAEYAYPDYILTEATQAAFDNALAAIKSGGGGRILFDSSIANSTIKIYWLAKKDFFGNNLIIDGQDKNIRFLYGYTHPCDQTENGICLRIHGNDNIVRNITWDYFQDGLHMRGGQRNLIENVTVNTICEDAMTFNGSGYICVDCIMRNCTYGRSTDKTIMINSGGGTGRAVITGCYSYNGNQPIRVSGSELIVVRDCEFAGSSNNGPRFGGSGTLVIFENNYSHGTKSGLRLQDNISALVRNNRIEGCSQYGIRYYTPTASLARLENNIITGNAHSLDIPLSAQVDLGGGLLNIHRDGWLSGPGTVAAPSVGGNTLRGNSPYDLINNTGSTVKAENNFWDHLTVPEVLANDVSGSVDVDPLGVP